MVQVRTPSHPAGRRVRGLEPTGRAGRSRPRRGPGQRPAEVTPASQTAFRGPASGPACLARAPVLCRLVPVSTGPDGSRRGQGLRRADGGEGELPLGTQLPPAAAEGGHVSLRQSWTPAPQTTARPFPARYRRRVPGCPLKSFLRAGGWFLWHPPSRPGRTCPVALLTGELCIEGPRPLVGPVDPASALSCRPPEPQAPWEGTGLDPPAQAADRPRVPAPAPQSPAPSPRACCPCTLGKMA